MSEPQRLLIKWVRAGGSFVVAFALVRWSDLPPLVAVGYLFLGVFIGLYVVLVGWWLSGLWRAVRNDWKNP